MPTPKVGIILLNYNNTPLTIDCVKSILANRYTNKTIYIVDNASQSKFLAQLRKFANQHSDKIKIIALKKNLGFTGGNNQGIKLAMKDKMDLIWLLNNDTVIEPNAIQKYVTCFTKNKLNKAHCTLSSIITYFDSDIIWCNGMYDLPFFNFPKSRDKGKSISDIPLADRLQKSQYSVGCSLFVSREFINTHGMMDERFFIYYDDLAFSFQKQNYFIQQPLVHHKVSATSGIMGSERFTPFQSYLYGKNAILFYFHTKQIPLWQKIVFLTCTIWVTAALYIRDLPTFQKYLHGLKDGFAQSNRVIA